MIAGLVLAQAVWIGPAAGGGMAVQEARTIEPGHFSVGMNADNYDRNNPFGLDIWDVRVQGRVGVILHLEFQWRYTIDRAVIVPGTEPVPPPPSDVVILDTRLMPKIPPRDLYWPAPYLRQHSASLEDMTPGEYVFGLKYHLGDQRGWRPETALTLETSIPGDLNPDVLAKGSGFGRVTWSILGAATWHSDHLDTSLNLGTTLLPRSLRRPDRFIYADSSPARVQDASPRIPQVIRGGIGLRARVIPGICGLAEGIASTGPVADALVGLELSHKGISLTLGLRQHLTVPKNGSARSTGAWGEGLDLSTLTPDAQAAYLTRIGVDPTVHRPDAHLIVIGNRMPYAPDPEDSRRIPSTRQMHTTGNMGYLASISFSF